MSCECDLPHWALLWQCYVWLTNGKGFAGFRSSYCMMHDAVSTPVLYLIFKAKAKSSFYCVWIGASIAGVVLILAVQRWMFMTRVNRTTYIFMVRKFFVFWSWGSWGWLDYDRQHACHGFDSKEVSEIHCQESGCDVSARKLPSLRFELLFRGLWASRGRSKFHFVWCIMTHLFVPAWEEMSVSWVEHLQSVGGVEAKGKSSVQGCLYLLWCEIG